MSCFLGSHPTPEKKHWWFIIFLFLVVLLWAPLYLVRRLSLTLLATKNGSVFKPWCFFPSLWSCRRASGAIKYYSKGQLPPPFPFKKSRVVCLELLHRQKTYKALVSIVLMCGTLKKIHTKGVGRAGASREQNCGAPFPPSLQTYEGFLLAQAKAVEVGGSTEHLQWCWFRVPINFFFLLLLRDAAGLLLHSSKSCSLAGKKGNASLPGVIFFVVLPGY